MDVFSKTKAETLAPHRPMEQAIDLEPGLMIPYEWIYTLSEDKFRNLKTFIETNLANSFIQRSSSSAAAPELFGKKEAGSQRVCVDYRALNSVTVKDRYPLPLIAEMFNRMRGARIFTKMDLWNAYHLIRIKEGDENNSALRTRYGQFEYKVLPFSSTNRAATSWPTLTTVNGLILTTLPYGTLTTYWSIRPMRRDTMITYKKF